MFKKNKNFYTDVYGFFVLKKKLSKKRIETIFKLLRVDGTFKTTFDNRMFDINKKLLKYLNKFFSRKVMICDFGISSGQSTFELFVDLGKSKIKNIYGFDKQIYFQLYKFKKFIFLFSLNKDLLMVEYDKYCLRYRYFYIFKKFEKILFHILSFMKIKFVISKVLVKDFDKIDKFKFFEQDIFNIDKKYYNLFDVVRVSNLLNYTYFSEVELKKAISNIKKISKENSVVLVSKTKNKKKNVGSFFRKKSGKFELLEDFNGGSEIKELML